MKLYLVQVEIFDLLDNENDIAFDTSSYCNVYSSFEKAKDEGLKNLKQRIKEIEEDFGITFKEMLEEEKLDYTFEITRNRRFRVHRKF